MFKYLEQLRQKPEKAKKKFAFLTTFSFVGIIFVIWLSVIYPDFTKQKEREEKVKSLDKSPFSSFFENVSLGFSQVGESISNVKKITNDIYINNFSSTSTAEISKTEIENITENNKTNTTSLEIYEVPDDSATTTKSPN